MEQVLEQILDSELRVGKKDMHGTIDVYATETTALYTPPPQPAFGHGMHSGPMVPQFDMHRVEQRTLNDFGIGNPIGVPRYEPPKIPEIKIEPYNSGMELDGGMKLYGNKNTAILHEDFGEGNSYDISHHNYGGGRIQFNPTPKDDPFKIKLPFERQTKLNDYL